MSDLYDQDVLLWSERQAELLRRVARGERVNDQVDWENVVEEIESVGRNERRACMSLLEQALLHMLKAAAWPDSRDAPTWRADAILFRHQAADAFTPSMSRSIDIETIYRRAISALPASIDGRPPIPVPGRCGLALEQLLGDELDLRFGD